MTTTLQRRESASFWEQFKKLIYWTRAAHLPGKSLGPGHKLNATHYNRKINAYKLDPLYFTTLRKTRTNKDETRRTLGR